MTLAIPVGLGQRSYEVLVGPGLLDEAGRRILVHALDCPDAQAMALDMKSRYERPLMEMFE